MKKLVYGATALTLAGTAFASDTDWSAFDNDSSVTALTTSLAAEKEGPVIGGFLQTLYSLDSDNDVSGFTVQRARVTVDGGRDGYEYHIGYETTQDGIFDDGLVDAFVTIPVSSISARFGLFRPAISRNGSTSSSRHFFINRSEIGNGFDGRQEGVGINGDFDQLSWWLSLTDGNDGDTDEYLIALRVALDLVGNGVGEVEGAYGGPDEIGAQASISFFDDGSVDDGDGIIIEGNAVSSIYSFGFEFADFSEGAGGAQTGNNPVGFLANDSSPLAVYGTYMLTPDQWEVGLRYQDVDDTADTSLIEVGVNHYLDGHNLKWGFGFRSVSSDNAGFEQDLIQVRLQVRF